MKTFIVPFDFSAVASTVFQNTCRLANRFNAAIKLIGVCPKPIPYGREEAEIAKVTQCAYQATEHKLKDFIENEERRASLTQPMAYQTFFGPVSEAIVEAAYSKDVEMIVLSANEACDIESQWKGSVFFNVAQHASRPVFITPSNYDFQNINEILFVCELGNMDELQIEATELALFAQSFGASVHIVFIKKTIDDYDFRAREKMLQIFSGAGLNAAVTSETMDGKSVADAIRTSARKKEFDLLALASHRQSFWKTIFDENIFNELVTKLKIPVLAIRSENVVPAEYRSTLKVEKRREEIYYH